jgi:hypothetical protein
MPVRLRATKTMGRSCARRRAYLTFAAFAVLAAYQPAQGQESSQLPTLERQRPGVAERIPNDVLPPSDAPSDYGLIAVPSAPSWPPYIATDNWGAGPTMVDAPSWLKYPMKKQRCYYVGRSRRR